MIEVGNLPKTISTLQEVPLKLFASYGTTVLNTFVAAGSESEGENDDEEALIVKANGKPRRKWLWRNLSA